MTDPKVTLAGERSLRPCVGYVVVVAGIGLVPPKRWLNQKLGRPLGRGVCAELANRGVKDVLIVCCDGLTGFPEAVAATWPAATVQTAWST
jgi:hypothetical protein